MSVLESMRSGTDSTAMQVVLALVLVSFIFWYAQPKGDQTSVVVTVNGTRVMSTDYTRALQREVRRYDRSLSDQEEAQIREKVRQQMIEDEVVLQEAQRLGIEASPREVARQLLGIEFLLDEDGNFDEQMYERFVSSQGYSSRGEFEEELRKDILRSKLRYLVYTGVTVSDPVLEEAFVHENTKVDVTYVRLRPATFTDDVQVDDADLASWMEANATRIKDRYDSEFERQYNIPEKVTVTMISLMVTGDGPGVADLKPVLEKVGDEIDAGADMGDLARKWSEDPSAEYGGSLGEVVTQKLPIPEADAIALLEVGKLSPVVIEDDRISLIRLDARSPAHVIPLEDVQKTIAEKLYREEKAPALQAAFAEKLLDDWKTSGDAPEASLADEGLATAQTGLQSIDSKGGGLFNPPAKMLRDAGRARPGDVLPEVYAEGEVLWVGELADRQEADMSEFAEKKDEIREEVLGERRIEFYQAWVDDLVGHAKVE